MSSILELKVEQFIFSIELLSYKGKLTNHKNISKEKIIKPTFSNHWKFSINFTGIYLYYLQYVAVFSLWTPPSLNKMFPNCPLSC